MTADRVQLQQVLMNLMLNAIEAMKDTAGDLTIKTEMGQVGRLLISVSDTGVGLPNEQRHQAEVKQQPTSLKVVGDGKRIQP